MPAAAGESRPTVSAAHLTDHAGQTEIRIEMQGDSLGSVELRAHINGDQIGASISAEHHDTQLLLANELPSLHSALAEKNLHVDLLTVSQGMPSSMGGGMGSGADHRWFSQSNSNPSYSIQDEASLPSEEIAAQSMNSGNLGGRLSVLA
jgi:flagellar hook-length control protein FliK